ncbi:MAG: nuclear transport factor 2 family protein [Myxococcaceae bacterium]
MTMRIPTNRAAAAPVPPTSAAPTAAATPEAAPSSAGWKPVTRAAPAVVNTPSPREVATTYFDAFARGDAKTMGAQYASNARFTDPIYSLQGQGDIAHMWSALLKTGKNLSLKSQVLESDGNQVKVAWQADYTLFGRKVHNESVSTMEVRDGRIVSQRDDWSWSKWARQAFPLGGLVDNALVKRGLLAVLNSI